MSDRFFSPQPNVPGEGIVASYGLAFWGLVVAIGVFAGVAGAALLLLLQAVEHLAWAYHSGTFLEGVQAASAPRRVLVLLAAGVIAGIGGSLLGRMRGMGAGEVSDAVWLQEGRMDVGPSIGRGVLSIVIVAMGASLGREAAPQLAGAAFASKVSEKAGIPLWQRRLLVACGAGAGIAAVYNIPLGGAVFALEVLLGTITLPLVLPALLTTVVATAVAWVALPNAAIYTIPSFTLSDSQLVWAVIVGPLAGLAAVAWVRLIEQVNRLRPRGRLQIAAPIVIFSALGGLAIAHPQLLGNGKDTVQLALAGELGASLLLVLGVLKPLATAACLGSGAPGGLFTPTLAYGVLFGGLLGHAWTPLWPGAAAGSYALIGGGAVLAASMQGPLAAIVMMIELANHSAALIVPLLIAVTGATIVARLLGAPSIYSARLGEKAPGRTAPPPGLGAHDEAPQAAGAPPDAGALPDAPTTTDPSTLPHAGIPPDLGSDAE